MKIIELNSETDVGLFTIVDDEDYDWLSEYSWHVNKGWKTLYAAKCVYTNGKSIATLMHREIIKPDDGVLVDHKDGNGLNNVRNNLRKTDKSGNGFNRGPQKNNTSGYKGVALMKWGWQAKITVRQKQIHLGYFKTPLEAAIAYNEAAIRLVGEQAKLNDV